MKKVLFIIILFILSLGLIGCQSHVRELPIKDTLIYCDCIRYDTIPNWDIQNDDPDYIMCTNRYTNEEERMTYQDYLKSNDINVFIKNILDDLYDEFMFLKNDIDDLQSKIDELQERITELKEMLDNLE